MTLASLLWGFGFVATVWTIQSYTPTEVVVYRFFLASIFGTIALFFIIGKKGLLNKQDFCKSFPAGFILGLMQLTQTIGLKSTTAGKSGFITSLYVILVPLIGSVFLKKYSSLLIYALAVLALIGTALLVKTDFRSFDVGDAWTFACAILAALHIIYIGLIVVKIAEPFRFNTYQSLWAFLTMAPLLFFQTEINVFHFSWISLAGLLFLCIGSSVLAFYFQIKAQRYLSDSTTTMISLLESPIAATFGFFLLAEVLNAVQFFGVLLILISSFLTIIVSRRKTD